MPSNTIRIRAQVNGGTTDVKALIRHPMSLKIVGGKTIPVHFIEQVTADLNGKRVWLANWSAGISKNPFLSFKIKGGKSGDTLKLSWVDNQGESDSIQATLS